jgi:diguanylate cyclase (GGDEF)-like protein
VLRQVGQLIRSQLRGNDVVARYGGEEFVLLLPDTQLGAGIETAERIRSAIAAQAMPMQTSERGAEPLRVTVSLGVSQLQLDASARDSSAQEAMALMRALVQQADSALYAAKQGGRNRVMAHQAESLEG